MLSYRGDCGSGHRTVRVQQVFEIGIILPIEAKVAMMRSNWMREAESKAEFLRIK